MNLFEKGLEYIQSGDLESALDCYQQILSHEPFQFEAELNSGVALLNLGRYHDALPYLRSSVIKAPSILTCGNLAICLFRLGQFDDAEVMFRRVITADPDNDIMAYNLAFNLLSQGQYLEGWHLFARRKKTIGWERHQPFEDIPTWCGEVLKDHQHLAIYHEQGLGDSLLLCRYILQAKQRAKNISIICPPSLDKLFRFSFLDFQCSMFDMPEIFRTAIGSIPKQPYLFADPTCVAKWADVLATLPAYPNIGLVWASNQYHGTSNALTAARRVVSFEQLAPIFEVANLNFIALQKGDAILESRRSSLRLHDWTDSLDDFAETAALMANLDLVISVDTSVVHLAGATGKPVWVLNRYESCYPWLVDQPIPWYETVCEFRQRAWGDWEAVIERVKSALCSRMT